MAAPPPGLTVSAPELRPGSPATLVVRLGNDDVLFLDAAAGPGTVAITRLVSQDPTDPNARAGLAMRNDLSGAGKAAGYVLLVAKPLNGFLLLWDADGSGTVAGLAAADARRVVVHGRVEPGRRPMDDDRHGDGAERRDDAGRRRGRVLAR